MAFTDIKIHYQSGACNGWPLCHVRINQQWIDTFEASGNSWHQSVELDDGPVTLTIEHWGKNPIADSGNPDKFINIIAIEINGVVCDFLLPESRKTIQPTPWNKQHLVFQGDLYLGHNCTLDFSIESPIGPWLKFRTSGTQKPIQGQESTYEVLTQAKKFFNIVKTL